MKEILPCIEDEDGEKELEGRNEDIVDEFGAGQFPRSEGGRLGVSGEEGIVPSGQGAGDEGVRGSHIFGESGGIDTKKAQ